MFVTNWISTTKIQKISEITNFFRHYFLSRTEVYFAFKYPLVHTSLMFCYINTEVSEKEKNTNVVSDFPEILYIMVLSHPLFDSVVI